MGTVRLGLVVSAQWEGMGRTHGSCACNPVCASTAVLVQPCWQRRSLQNTSLEDRVRYSAWLFLNIIPGKFSVSELIQKIFGIEQVILMPFYVYSLTFHTVHHLGTQEQTHKQHNVF